MYDPDTKRGVLNDFDLARLVEGNEGAGGKENTGTMPFMALDLLNDQAFKGMVPRLYRHDAESFAWCLVYICICMKKEGDKISVIGPHPLAPWFMGPDSCFHFKLKGTARLLVEVPLHDRYKDFAAALRRHWVERHDRQLAAEDSAMYKLPEPTRAFPGHFLPKSSSIVPKKKVYEEPSDREWFRQVYQLLVVSRDIVPESKYSIFLEMVDLVIKMYGFVTSDDPVS